jgi:hypothetical protein
MTSLATGVQLLAIVCLALFAFLPRKAGLYRPEHARLAVASASSSILSVVLHVLAA